MKSNAFIKSAEQYCLDNQLRLTPPRQYVLDILAKADKPLGAYDVLERLGQYIDKPKPPTAYRAIDFWKDHGFVHKIESLNAYVACCEEHTHHNTHFLICDDCNGVEEVHSHDVKDIEVPKGFVSKRTFTETHGTCEDCQK